MTAERWRRIEELFHAARECAAESRAPFLAEACAGDSDLRREVESLLAEDASRDEMLDRPAVPELSIGSQLGPYHIDAELRREVELMPADSNQPDATLSMTAAESVSSADTLTTWGSFQLIEKVGEGSFGEVYRAFDIVLEREVALKLLLHGRLRRGEEAGALREARSMAKVRHPNVVPVYGVDRHQGRPGFWSEFVRGKTLSALLAAQGPFGPREVALIGIDIARAVSAVHAARLLHRDIKASNVMREEGGRIVLMDFGLTHPRDAASHAGGTLPYMAPELFRGKRASVASDIYAVGVVLFYLLTGKHPIGGNSTAKPTEAHDRGTRRRLLDERPDLPEQLANVIETALDPAPEKRYASAGAMIAALSDAAGLSSATAGTDIHATRPNRLWLWGVAATALLLAAVAYSFPGPFRGLLPPGRQSAPAGSSAREDYVKAQDLLNRTYSAHDIDTAIVLFRKTVKEDPSFAPGHAGLARALWSKYRDTHESDLIAQVRTTCNRALELDRDNASAHITSAMVYTDAGRAELAAEELKEALRLNSRSADAYSALAELYQKEGRTADVEPSIQKAVDLAPGVWPYVNQLGNYYLSTGKYTAAAQEFQRALKLNPDNARAYNNLGLAYLRQNRLADAQDAFEKSLRIEPTFARLSNLGMILEFEGKNEEAVKVYQRAVDLNPSSYVSWANLASAQNRLPGSRSLARKTYVKAISVGEAALANAPDDAATIADLGSYYAYLGMDGKGVPLLRQASVLSPDNPQVLYRVAEGYELLGRRQDAVTWIRKALDAGLARETVERNPELSSLRADPGFPAK